MNTVTKLDREDPELGTVRLCTRCGEEWPKDRDFFYFDPAGRVMGHCRACVADRRDRDRQDRFLVMARRTFARSPKGATA